MKSGIGRHLLIIEIHLHAPLEEVEGKLDFKCADKIQFKYKQCGLVNTPPLCLNEHLLQFSVFTFYI